ncbi:hypothetical protein Bca52824_074017 [Brassica carinata]|uniref:Uncharacterized protein n=1 Tax=Brassica carinata TaxID=52824 RepID=A0A8X7QC78_BRACI|nr:hypothetical protein Bca52824_074017 [Brassica carinata]
MISISKPKSLIKPQNYSAKLLPWQRNPPGRVSSENLPSPGPAESGFRFRETVMQGFISSLRAPTYLPHVKAGATYTLQNFYAAKSKEIYCFADQSSTHMRISKLIVVSGCRWPLEADEWTVLDEAEIINMRHVLIFITQKLIKSMLSSNPKIAKRLNADEVTRAETMTIGKILAYIKQEYAKEGSFDCIATIDDVERDSAWYYIACIGCQSNAIKGPYSLMCQISPSTTITTGFVILGDAGRELTGKNAVELVDNYFEANQELGVGHEMSAPNSPQALIDTPLVKHISSG